MKRHAKAWSVGSVDSKGSGARAIRLLAVLALAATGLLALAVPASAATPILDVNPASEVEYTTAHVSGSIDNGGEQLAYGFQYSIDPSTEGWSNAPGFESVIEADETGEIPVSSDLTGLAPGTTYQVRLFAIGAFGDTTSPEPNPTFTTKAVAKPNATFDPITIFTENTAYFSGTVDANAPGPLDAVGEAAYQTAWNFECEPGCPGLAGGVVNADEPAQAISVGATFLEPNTFYEVRLLATNAGGTTTSVQTFHTPLIPPAVKTAAGASDGSGGYFLQGVVTPFNSEVTDCHFEYGLTASYGFTAPCSPPPGDKSLPVVVEAHLTGLTPDTTYHFQVAATNGAGTVESGDGTFVPTLEPSGPACPNAAVRAENESLSLPECRAYEQVSAPDKTGYPARLSAYFEGKSVGFETFAGNINGSGQASPTPNVYVANRSDGGWETISGLNGSTGSIFSGSEGLFGPSRPSLFSADLQSSLWYVRPGAVSYSDRDPYLREPGGHFTRIGSSIPGAGGNLAASITAGGSADLSHLVFNGEAPPAAPYLGSGVFEFVGTGNDQPLRVDVDNGGGQISHCGPVAFTPGSAFANAVSRDGSTIFFTAIGGCGAGNPAANEVWARVDGTTSYDASESQCTRNAADPGGVCNAPAPAQFEGAAADGSSVYFTTMQQLVNGDTDDASDLYVYDLPTEANPSPALSEVSGPGSKANVEEVARTSEDGSTAYFVASGVLAGNVDVFGEEAVAGDHNLYVWRRDASHPGGQTKFIASLLSDDLRTAGDGNPQAPQTTADGRYLLLTTASPIVPTDSDNARDVYRYDADTGDLKRVSTNTFGVGGNVDGPDASLSSPQYEVPREHTHPGITGDGEAIVFSTTEALSPLDVNGAPDIYLWKSGHVSLITTGLAGGGGNIAHIDDSGQDIYFETAKQLSPSDGDDVNDVYDARIGGGFSFATPAKCSGETCQPAGASPSASPTLATHGAAIESRPKPSCPKGKVVKRGRCVKKHHHRKPHKKAKRTAHGDRGGTR